MLRVTQKDLMPGVRLTAIHTTKFKTCLLSFSFLDPLSASTASLNALIPSVLRRGTAEYPDMESLSAALDELYGGAIESLVRKKGETQLIGFAGSFLDDVYVPDGSRILEPAAQLMGQMLLAPVMENGNFRTDYLDSERTNLINRIRAMINEKRQYSVSRLTSLMCQGEAYGVDKLGSEETAAAITGESLLDRYQQLLRSAPLQVYYCGSAPLERVEATVRSALSGLPAGPRNPRPGCEILRKANTEKPRHFEDRMDVTQGKLVLGFRLGGDDIPALIAFNAVYGGTTTSKLFLNVREKLSLCYYASSTLERAKRILLVSSGIEFEKYEQARSEILAQLEACQKGQITQEELVAAKAYVISSLRSSMDSQGRLEEYWLGQAAYGSEETPEQLADAVEQVTLEQVIEAARNTVLDAEYFLNGKEA